MLEARKTSAWRSRYRVLQNDREITTWDGKTWKTGGDFELEGRRYQVRGNTWGNKFTMIDDAGAQLVSADRVGRKRWTVEAAGQTYHFQRASIWSHTQELHNAAGPIGQVKRTSAWTSHASADLPGLPLPVQIFVLGVVISMWEAQDSAAAG